MHTEPSNDHLSDSHRRMLCDESRIRPEIISERGYRTITSVKELADLGFAPKQRCVPGLLMTAATLTAQGVCGHVAVCKVCRACVEERRLNG